MEEILIQNAQAYVSQHQLQLAERLGFGIHGIIFVAEGKSTAGKTALKVHRSVEPYLREQNSESDNWLQFLPTVQFTVAPYFCADFCMA